MWRIAASGSAKCSRVNDERTTSKLAAGKASGMVHRSATRNSSSHASGGSGVWMSTPTNRAMRAEGRQRADAAAAGIEDHRPRRRQGIVEEVVQDLRGRGAQPKTWQDGQPSLGRGEVRGALRAGQVADGAGTGAAEAAGVIGSTVSSHRSASMAARQPSPAAVTAWR